MFNYQKICLDLLKDLPQKQKEIILRRFGLKRPGVPAEGVSGRYPERATLESIGQDFSITRERVRQIEEDGLEKVKPKGKKYQKIFQYFKKHLKSFGDLRKEELLLAELGGKIWQNQIYFLLNLDPVFKRYGESDDFYSLWLINPSSLGKAKETLNSLYQKLEETKKPFTLKEISALFSLKNSVLESFLEISKKIQINKEGLYGLKDWPEINPKGVKDKAYLVFKKKEKPLHFSRVANLIENSLVQTVHNELIRDPRFVLVGRGVYALKEWGYYPGQVKDVITKVLKENGPQSKEKILEKVLKQRLVKENTILLNLSNRKYFLRDSQGKYRINPEIA
jgi:hypothetical protein